MKLISKARRVLDVLREPPPQPEQRHDLDTTDRLERVAQALELYREQLYQRAQERRGTVLVLGKPMDPGTRGPGAFIAARQFIGHPGESQQQAISADIALAPQLWIVAVGEIELMHVVLGTEPQHVTRDVLGPVCLIDVPWELGRVLRVDVRFLL